MFVLKAKQDCFDAAKDARKNPPLLITLLLSVVVYALFALAMNQVIRYAFKGISAFIKWLYTSGAIETADFEFYNEMNTFAYAVVFIALIPLGYLYAKKVEGRRRISESFLIDNKAERFPHILIGFFIGAAISLLIIGIVVFTGAVSVSAGKNVNWLCRLIGLVFTSVMVYSQEYFFRGFLLSSFSASTEKPAAAIILSSLVYAVCMHFMFYSAFEVNFWYLINNFLFGVVLALIMIRFHSMYVSVGVHFAMNLIVQLIFGLSLGRYTYYFSFLSSGYLADPWFAHSSVFSVSSRFISSVADSEIYCLDSGFAFLFVCVIAVIVLLAIPSKDPDEPDENEPVKAFSHVTETGSAKVAEKKTSELSFDEETTAEMSDVLKERLANSETERSKPEKTPSVSVPEKNGKAKTVPSKAAANPATEPESVKSEPAPAPAKPVQPKPEVEQEIKPGMTVSAKKSNPFMSAAKTVKRQEYSPKARPVVNNTVNTAKPAVDDEDWDEEEKREHVDSTYLPIDQYLKDKNAK